MSEVSGKQAASPLAALLLAFATISCCVPLGFLGALGLAGLAARVQPYRVWFIAGAVALLSFGFYQLYGRKGQCERHTKVNVVLLWVTLAIVAVIFLFPQVIASLVASLE